jgi:acetyl esterase/lipase
VNEPNLTAAGVHPPKATRPVPLAAIDPELTRILDGLPSVGTESHLHDLELIRSLRDTLAIMEVLGTTLPSDERVTVENVSVPGPHAGGEVLVRLYRPVERGSGALLFLHGGAYVLGDVYVEEERCLQLAVEGRCLVVSVDYALAPEAPYPAGLEDAYAGLRWVSTQATTLGIDPSRVAVGGSSAGGGLAAALALLARERGGPPVCFQLLVYPMLDDRMDTPSMSLAGTPLLSPRAAADGWGHYLAGRPADHLAAPGRASDLGDLPTAYVVVAEHDPLRDEGIDYARRLVAAGVPTELHLYPGTFHGFDLVGARTRIGRRALEEQARALRQALVT